MIASIVKRKDSDDRNFLDAAENVAQKESPASLCRRSGRDAEWQTPGAAIMEWVSWVESAA